jgi:hypothetical protein
MQTHGSKHEHKEGVPETTMKGSRAITEDAELGTQAREPIETGEWKQRTVVGFGGRSAAPLRRLLQAVAQNNVDKING